MRIDSKSVASHHLVLYAFSEAVGSGTGFFVCVDGIYLLLTNYHLVSGRHPKTGSQLTTCSNIPDRILIPVLRKSGTELNWFPIVQRLNDYGKPTWSEHPNLSHQFDVVALPVNVPPDCNLFPYPLDEGPDIAIRPSSDVSIIGFPEGMSGSGITAIWKTGAIASEPELKVEDEDFFWIDANTRSGMSGSPVVARRFGNALMNDGSNAMYNDTVDRILGVYAGRALEAPDMTLGRVWKWKAVKDVIEVAVSKCQRGILHSYPCHIGYFYEPEKNMVNIDISKSVKIPVKDQTGNVVVNDVAVSDIIRDFVLNDGRFGQNLERVKIAAKIASSLDNALTNKTMMEVGDADYAIMREAIENPTNSYNPATARLILPLLEHILEAGKDDKEKENN